MRYRRQFFRSLFFIFLLACLLIGLVGIIRVPVKAASSNIVISQVYGGGGNSGAPYTNDYVELFNLGSITIYFSTTPMSIQYASATGSSWSMTPLIGSIAPGQYHLVQLGPNSTVGSPLPTPDTTGAASIDMSSTAGKVALVNGTTALSGTCPSTNVIDYIGYGSAPNCFEIASAPSPSNTTAIIRTNVCTDTDNNSADFATGIPNPRNTSTFPIACIKIINVDSTVSDGPYTTGATIDIDIEFSVPVNVTGQPYLLLETGANDNRATYVPGSDGDQVLTFRYVVAAGDVSGDLDYVSKDSLVLNGGTITGAAGNAVLTLPSPGAPGSLGANKNIVIDNGSAPQLVSFKRQDPTSLQTNADTLTFRVTFNQAVNNVDANDFVVTGVTGPTVTGSFVTGLIYDITVSGGNLASLDGVVRLDLSNSQDITNGVYPLPVGEPAIDETYTVDNTQPTINTFSLAAGQLPNDTEMPVNFAVTFSEKIDINSFIPSDIVQDATATATGVAWSITDSGDGTNILVKAVSAASNGTLIPFIDVGLVKDLAGNNNINSAIAPIVNFQDTTAPTITINQATDQSDPTAFFPIDFTVVFSEPIIASIFTPSDITQNGTATGVTWSITNSGDNRTFTVSAVSSTGSGTIQPSIAANRVTDLVGNNNSPSRSTDNTVTYDITRPTVTINQASGQADPTSTLPINFTVAFSEPIDASTFTAADITEAGTATGIVWNIANADAGVNRTFTLSATAMTKNGTVIPAIGINKVTDVAGNNNSPSTSTDNMVTFTGVVPTPTHTPTPTATPTPTLGIVINEVAWMGTAASASDEWVELYNGGSTVVDLSNWTLKSTDNTISITFLSTDSDHFIAPGEFFVLAPTGAFTDVVINKTIVVSFNNNGKSLELRNNLGVLIDTANSNGGPWPAGKGSPTYATMERHAGAVLDSDINWYTFAGTPTSHDRNGNLVNGTPGYANWAISVIATPSPIPTLHVPTKTSTPAPLPPPPLIAINEFVPRPGNDWNNDGVVNTNDEYIELLNHGVINVNLSGYKLDDEANIGSNPFALPSITLQPGERIVFYGSETGLLLSDGGDGVRLLKPNGQLLDAYNYVVAEFPDQSICRLPDNGGADDWNEHCYPTPGLKNSLSGSSLRPPTQEDEDQPLCPIADTLPYEFVLAECMPFGNNIWNRNYWDKFGWYGEMFLPNMNGKWEVFAD